MSNTVNEIYDLREKFIIIGLTGKYESGCTSTANILRKMWYKEKDQMLKLYSDDIWGNEEISACEKAIRIRRFEIVCKFAKENARYFRVLEFNKVILLLAVYKLTSDQEVIQVEDEKDTSTSSGNNSSSQFDSATDSCEDADGKIEKRIKEALRSKTSELEEFFVCCQDDSTANKEKLKEIASKYGKFNDVSSKLLKKIRRIVGDKYKMELLIHEWAYQLRESNQILSYYPLSDKIRKRFIPQKDKESKYSVSWIVAHTINNFIKLIRNIDANNHTARIIVDKFVNPMEIMYLRERYSTFFLMAVNQDKAICKHKASIGEEDEEKINGPLTREEKEGVDSKSSLRTWSFLRTDINSCITLADIHINNNAARQQLPIKLLPYYTLILHPGLVQPTSEERIMQLAYTASLSSGCLSRQVGAVVTNSDYSVKAVGWNSVPEGQLPCTLRSLEFIDDPDYEFKEYYSNFEKNNAKFSKHCALVKDKYIQTIRKTSLCGVPLSYCFKDIYTSFSNKDSGNQVHTRSLHAEENAFLQLAKYGSEGINGGILFTTDQCCVLCAKKAYQLGIRRIYYIDPYSDIAPTHILQCPHPQPSCAPKLIRYEGAVGPAYSKIYMPFFSQKDEISCRLNLDMNDVSSELSNNPKGEKQQEPNLANDANSEDKH